MGLLQELAMWLFGLLFWLAFCIAQPLALGYLILGPVALIFRKSYRAHPGQSEEANARWGQIPWVILLCACVLVILALYPLLGAPPIDWWLYSGMATFALLVTTLGTIVVLAITTFAQLKQGSNPKRGILILSHLGLLVALITLLFTAILAPTGPRSIVDEMTLQGYRYNLVGDVGNLDEPHGAHYRVLQCDAANRLCREVCYLYIPHVIQAQGELAYNGQTGELVATGYGPFRGDIYTCRYQVAIPR